MLFLARVNPVYRGLKVGVVVPAYNEEALIATTLTAMPELVDRVVAVNDGSTDGTSGALARAADADGRIHLIDRQENRGLGASLVEGYEFLIDDGMDVTVVMAGDAQMDPNHLPALLDPIADGTADAAKGNRFLQHGEALQRMPRNRVLGNIGMTLATKIASGYWSIFDAQNGYVAIRTDLLRRIDLGRLAKGYVVENAFLIEANIAGARITDVAMPAVYGDEKSTISIFKFIPQAIGLLTFGLMRRIWRRYVVVNTHPVALFFYFGLLLTAWGLGFGVWAIIETAGPDAVATAGTVMLSVIPFLMGFQLLLAAVILDILSEPK